MTYDNERYKFILELVKNCYINDLILDIKLHPKLKKDQYDYMIEILKNFNVTISENMSGSSMMNGGLGFQKDLDNAYAVVGFNSNALTESAMEGIPTFSMCPSSMALDVSNKSLEYIENPVMFERQQWLNNLAYCQWREDECVAGLPWEHLRKRFR